MRGSLRVQTWLHSAIWPLHEGLLREARLIASGDLTFTHAHGRLDGVRAATDMLGAASRVNLADLIEVAAPELAAPLAAHGDGVLALTEAATQTHAALAGGPVRDAVARAGKNRRADETVVNALAQDVVNGALDHDVVGPESDLVLALRPQLATVRQSPAMVALDAARAALVAANHALVATLEEVRTRLCDEYDLPPAPPLYHTVPDHQYR
jgi:hypothetical protein